MGTVTKKSYSNELNEFTWNLFPSIVNNYSISLGNILRDGKYLSRLTNHTYLIPPILFLIGLVIGGNHIGFETQEVYTFSSTTTIVMLCLSMWGSAFGFWLWLGYSIGDLFIYSFIEFINSGNYLGNTIIKGTIFFLQHYFLPKIISVTLLYSLLVWMPIIAANIRIRTLKERNWNDISKAFMHIIVYSLSCGIFTYCWVRAAPTLIQPVYTWKGAAGQSPYTQPLYVEASKLVWASIILGFLRFYIEFFYAKSDENNSKVKNLEIQSKMTEVFSLKGLTVMLFRNIFIVFMLAALLTTWRDALFLLLLLLALSFLRKLMTVKGNAWRMMVGRIPYFFRVIISVASAIWASTTILKTPFETQSPDYFKYILLAILVSILIAYILLPDRNVFFISKPEKSS